MRFCQSILKVGGVSSGMRDSGSAMRHEASAFPGKAISYSWPANFRLLRRKDAMSRESWLAGTADGVVDLQLQRPDG
jgi:hypothetical protein